MLVVDSCVLIHLSRIGKLDFLKGDECCTTDDVYIPRHDLIAQRRSFIKLPQSFRQNHNFFIN